MILYGPGPVCIILVYVMQGLATKEDVAKNEITQGNLVCINHSTLQLATNDFIEFSGLRQVLIL